VDIGSREAKEKRALVWVANDAFNGWICSQCEWNSPLPTLLAASDAKAAYDRLAEGKFRQHSCEHFRPRMQAPEAGYMSRLKKLVSQGFKPKDAVEILLQEVELETRSDQRIMQQARQDGEDFLRRVRQGLL
jgi:hypothetical protein